MNPVERTLRRVDRYQQRHGWLGFLFAVVKKFGDDKGGNLTTLLAWNGFFALFPLLLILVTGLGFLLSRQPALERRRARLQSHRLEAGFEDHLSAEIACHPFDPGHWQRAPGTGNGDCLFEPGSRPGI